jgi:hypothetical protein
MFQLNVLALIASVCVSSVRQEVLSCKSEVVNCIFETVQTDVGRDSKEIQKCIDQGKKYITKADKEKRK